MPDTLVLEVRDAATFIPVIAIRTRSDNPQEAWLFRAAGWSEDGNDVMIIRADGEGKINRFWNDYGLSDACTLAVAHRYIHEHWDELNPGDVVDVEYILGLSNSPKQSERRHYE